MSDATEPYRRQRLEEINAHPGSRETLEAQHGQVWSTEELRQDFDVTGFLAPFVVVRRKSDGKKGSLEFQHNPRFYFNVIKGTDLNSPLFSAHISQNHAVDYTHPFAGTGTAPFNLMVPPLAGDSLRFIVFSGPQGQDGSFDNTALQVSVVQVPEPSSVVLSGIAALVLFGVACRRCRRCRAA